MESRRPLAAAAAAKSLQSCPTLFDPIDGSPPGSPVPGILQARTLEWVAISFSNAWKWKVKVRSLSRVRLVATPWTAAHQAPPSMGFSRQEYWSGVPLHLGGNKMLVRPWRFWYCWEESIRRWILCQSSALPGCVLSHSVVSNSLQPHGLEPTRLLCPWNFQGRILECHAISYSRDLSWLRDHLLYWQAGALPLATPGKPPVGS